MNPFRLIAIAALAAAPCLALGQSSPGFIPGQILDAAALNAAFVAKQDFGTGGGGDEAAGTPGLPVPGMAEYVGINVGGTLRGLTGVNPSGSIYAAQMDLASVGGTSVALGQAAMAASIPVVIANNQGAVPVSQSGTWTVQPGNTANTTPWLATINQGGNSAAVTGANALKVDGSAVTQPVSGTVTANLGTLNGAATAANQTNASQKTQIVDGSGNVIASTSNNLNVQCANCSGAGASAVDEASYTAGSSVFAPTGGFFQTTATTGPLTNGQQGMQQMTAYRAGMVNLRNAAGTEVGTAASPLQVSLANTGSNATNIAINEAQINGVTPLMGNGTTGTGSLRVTIASDNTANSNPWLVTGSGTAGSAAAGVVTIQGIASMTKLLVTPDALPANQSTNVAQINAVTPLMGNGTTGTGSLRVTIASDNTANSNPWIVNPGTAANWGVGATASAVPANSIYNGINVAGNLRGLTGANPGGGSVYAAQVDLASVGGTTVVNGGVAGSQSVGGTAATNGVLTASPLNLGVQAISTENTAVTATRQVQLVADLTGKLIVLPYANKENFVKGTTAAMTGTTSTQLIALVSSQKIYVTHISCVNSHASVGTFVTVQDGSGGTALTTLAANSGYGGDEQTGTTPLFWTTAGNGLYVADVTTGANVICNASGYSGV